MFLMRYLVFVFSLSLQGLLPVLACSDLPEKLSHAVFSQKPIVAKMCWFMDNEQLRSFAQVSRRINEGMRQVDADLPLLQRPYLPFNARVARQHPSYDSFMRFLQVFEGFDRGKYAGCIKDDSWKRHPIRWDDYQLLRSHSGDLFSIILTPAEVKNLKHKLEFSYLMFDALENICPQTSPLFVRETFADREDDVEVLSYTAENLLSLVRKIGLARVMLMLDTPVDLSFVCSHDLTREHGTIAELEALGLDEMKAFVRLIGLYANTDCYNQHSTQDRTAFHTPEKLFFILSALTPEQRLLLQDQAFFERCAPWSTGALPDYCKLIQNVSNAHESYIRFLNENKQSVFGRLLWYDATICGWALEENMIWALNLVQANESALNQSFKTKESTTNQPFLRFWLELKSGPLKNEYDSINAFVIAALHFKPKVVAMLSNDPSLLLQYFVNEGVFVSLVNAIELSQSHVRIKAIISLVESMKQFAGRHLSNADQIDIASALLDYNFRKLTTALNEAGFINILKYVWLNRTEELLPQIRRFGSGEFSSEAFHALCVDFKQRNSHASPGYYTFDKFLKEAYFHQKSKPATMRGHFLDSYGDQLFKYANNYDIQALIKNEIGNMSCEDITALVDLLAEKDAEIAAAEKPFQRVLDIIRAVKASMPPTTSSLGE